MFASDAISTSFSGINHSFTTLSLAFLVHFHTSLPYKHMFTTHFETPHFPFHEQQIDCINVVLIAIWWTIKTRFINKYNSHDISPCSLVLPSISFDCKSEPRQITSLQAEFISLQREMNRAKIQLFISPELFLHHILITTLALPIDGLYYHHLISWLSFIMHHQKIFNNER